MAPAAAQPTTTQPNQVERKRLKKGDRAPFAGNLLTDAALAKLITDYESRIKRLKLELEKTKRETAARATTAAAVCKAKLDGADAKLAAFKGGCDRERAVYERALKKCSTSAPWYKQPYLHFLVGSVVGGGLCAAATRVR